LPMGEAAGGFGRRTTGPLVSVVIPTYNHADFLPAALKSVQAQTYGPVEIVVVDDFSTDNTEEVVAQHAPPHTTYIKSANKGLVATSRNVGTRAANGEYIAFLDADDAWVPNKLELQLPHFADPSLVAVASDLRYTGARSYAPSRRGRGPSGFRDYRNRQIVRDNPIATSSVVMRRRDLDRVGGFDESPEFRFIEDWELWLRLTVDKSVRVLEQPLVIYRIAAQERPKIPILTNRLKVIEKHLRLGHLSRADAAAAAASVHFAIGVAAFPVDAPTSRVNFRAAGKLAATRRVAALAATARAATLLPRQLRVAGARALRWANQWARFA
jgi:glycosyltransferase involved in cell wall biosynthesis